MTQAQALPLVLQEVSDKSSLRAFVRMTIDLYKNDPAFIQPLEFEVLGRLNPKSNPLLANNEHQLWIVWRDGKVIGRIGGIINQTHNHHYNEKTAHFGYFEAIDDQSVIDLLFKTVEEWAHQKRATKIAGPYNFSVNEECGLLVDGFERAPVVMMPHGTSYYLSHLNRLGYQKATDMYALWYPARYEFMAEKRRKFVDKILNKGRVEIRNFKPGSFKEDVLTSVKIFNDAWANNWGFIPLSDDEAKHMASELRPIINMYHTVLCYVDDEPAAFGIVLPNINEAAKGMDGKLFPLNWLKFLWRLKIKKVSTARMPLMGIKQKYQGKPLGAAFAYKIIEMVNNSSVDNGVTHAELSWILESNKAMLTMLEDIGGVIDKTYRILEKPLR